MLKNDSLHIEKRKYIRYEKFLTIKIVKIKDPDSNIVPISRKNAPADFCVKAMLLDISAGGLSIYCETQLSDEDTYYTFIEIPGQEPVEFSYKVIRSENVEENPGKIYGCKFVGEAPDLSSLQVD